MTHAELREAIAVYRDLRGAEREEVDRHLAGCAECSSLLNAYRIMDRNFAGLRDARPDKRLREGFYAAIGGGNAASRVQPRARLTLVAFAAAAVLLVVVVSVVALWQSGLPGRVNTINRPVATPVPTPHSSLVGSFVWQTDGAYGYQMLRPAGWEAKDLGNTRQYVAPGPANRLDWMTLEAVNYEARYGGERRSEAASSWEYAAFEQNSTLEGWSSAVEQKLRSLDAQPELVRSLPDVRIYTARKDIIGSLSLMALKVQGGQPLDIRLWTSGTYADVDWLESQGVLDDFVTMAESARAFPVNPQYIMPPLNALPTPTTPYPATTPLAAHAPQPAATSPRATDLPTIAGTAFPSVPTGWQTYTDPVVGYALDYPATWHVAAQSYPNIISLASDSPVTWGKSPSPDGGSKIEVVPEQPGGFNTLDQLVDQLKKGGDGGVPQIVREERWQLAGGVMAVRLDMKLPAGTIAALVAVVNGRGLTMFGYGDLAPLDAIARSLRPVSQPTSDETPVPVLVDGRDIWRYTDSTYRVRLDYPPSWTLLARSDPHRIALRQGEFVLNIGVKRVGEPEAIVRTGVGAGDPVTRGQVSVLGQQVSRDVLVYQGKDKGVLYNQAKEFAAGNLVFAISLDSYLDPAQPAIYRYDTVELAPDVQAEADRIVASFALVPAAALPPAATATPIVQPTAMSQTGRTAPLWEDYQEALLQVILPTAAPNAICEWVVLGRAEQEVYVWAYCTGYLRGAVRTAASLPAAVTLAGDGRIVTVRVPGDGSLYEADVRSLFPADVQALILGGTLSQTAIPALEQHALQRLASPQLPPLAADEILAPGPASTFTPVPTATNVASGATPIPTQAAPITEEEAKGASEAIRRQLISDAQVSDNWGDPSTLRILGQRRWERGVAVVFSTQLPSTASRSVTELFGYRLVEKDSTTGNWVAREGGGSDLGRVPEGQLVGYCTGWVQGMDWVGTIVYGRTLSPQIRAVEVVFATGETLRDEITGGVFAVTLAHKPSLFQLRILGSGDQVLATIERPDYAIQQPWATLASAAGSSAAVPAGKSTPTPPVQTAASQAGRIVFEARIGTGSDIFSMNSDGSDVRQLTHGPDLNLEPACSPDGSRIAFTAWLRGSTRQLHVMDADGSHERQLVDGPGNLAEPAWSPDGRQITYNSEADKAFYVVSADGSGKARLPITGANLSSPVWSPDGQRLAYTSYTGKSSDLHVARLDGSGDVNLTGSIGFAHRPAWSPDGRQIAFYGNRGESNTYQIYVMNVDGSNLRQLTGPSDSPYERNNWRPVWSPDGKKIAFYSDWDHNGIWTMNADGSGQIRLTDPLLDASNPCWLPAR